MARTCRNSLKGDCMTKEQLKYMIQYARTLLRLARSIPSKDYERQAWKVIREIEREIKTYQNKAA